MSESVLLSGDAVRGYRPYVETPEIRSAVAALPTTVKLGLKKSPVRPTCLRFEKYCTPLLLGAVPPPAYVDYYTKAALSMARMYANDQYGDCVIASFAHRLGVWSANDPDSFGGQTVLATDREIVDQYFSVCGPGDNGCYIPRVLDYGIQQGLLAGGKRYKITGYVSCDWRDKLLVQTAIYLFGAGCIGFDLPGDWTNQSVWRPTNSRIVGGHDVALVGYDPTGVIVSSWGRLYNFTWEAFLSQRYIGELYFMVPEFLWSGLDGKTPSGVDLATLKRDMETLRDGGIPPLPDPNPPPPPPPPTHLVLTATPSEGVAPLTVSFTKNDFPIPPDITWRFDFGDGGVTTGPFTFPYVYRYNKPGEYLALFTAGNSPDITTASAVVTVTEKPVPPPIPGPPWVVTGRAKGVIKVPVGPFGGQTREVSVDLPVTGTAQPQNTSLENEFCNWSVVDDKTTLEVSQQAYNLGCDITNSLRSLSPDTRGALMFREFLQRIQELLSDFRPLQRVGILRDIAGWIRQDKDEAEVARLAHEKYGKLTPEQWQAIIQLIIQVLPLILALFGG